MSNILSKPYLISRFTFLEILKSKILYNVFFLGFALVVVTYVAHQFTYGTPQKVAIDFGLGFLSLSSVGISIFFGSTLLKNEIESRTIYMVLSRPVSRVQFILGKVLGLTAVLSVNIFILAILSLLVFLWSGGSLSPLIFWQIGFTFLEAVIVLLMVTFLSLLTNQVLSILFTLFLYLCGYAILEVKSLSFVLNRSFLKNLLELYDFFLPAFYRFNIKDHVLYQENLDLTYYFSTVAYGLVFILIFLLLITMIFNKKSLD